MNNYENVLNPKRAVYSVIGAICNEPDILKNPDFNISEDDFVDTFHQIAFSAINNLALSDSDVSSVTPVDIDNYLSALPTQYKIWTDAKGMKYVHDAKNDENKDTFKFAYERLKKNSLLRNLCKNGIDIKDMYDYNADLQDMAEENEKLDNLTINSILDHYTQKIINVRENWNVDTGTVHDFIASEGLLDLINNIDDDPDWGYPYDNLYFNTIMKGMHSSCLLLRSGDTNTGKTRQSVKDMCYIACDEMYEEGGKWVSLGQKFPCLFISTEIEKDKLQKNMLAFISGISEDVIDEGGYDKGTVDRLVHAAKIISRAEFYVSVIEDFSVSDIEMKVEEYIIKHGVQFVAFDYIQVTPKLSLTMQESFGKTLRDDQLLVHLSAALKRIADKHEVYIISATQVSEKVYLPETRNQSCLRGGRATADKIDVGMILYEVGEDERRKVRNIIDQNGFNREPNYSYWIYKNRYGSKKIVVWSYMDMKTMRETALFCTDYDYNFIDIKETEITSYLSEEEDDKF